MWTASTPPCQLRSSPQRKGRGRVSTPPQRRYQAIICGSRQKCADVNQLPFALQWLNDDVTLEPRNPCWYRDKAKVPNRYVSARLGVEDEIPTPKKLRHFAGLQISTRDNRTGDVERCLVLWGLDVRYGDIEARRGRDRGKAHSIGVFYEFSFSAQIELQREGAGAGPGRVARIY